MANLFDKTTTNMPQRSIFNQNHELKTTLNTGDLVPIYYNEIVPGDTFQINSNLVIRQSTPIVPVMDNAFFDTQFFFVPSRILWANFRQFHGENKTDAWDQKTQYTMPGIKAPAGGWTTGSLADYFGIPIGVSNIEVNHLLFRAYVKVWEEWFRDQNTMLPALNEFGDSTTQGVNGGDPIATAIKGGSLLPAAKYKDKFTSALPSPQKGAAVGLALLGTAPVIVTNNAKLGDVGSPVTSVSVNGNSLRGPVTASPNFDGSSTKLDVNGADIGEINVPILSGFETDLSKATAGNVNDLRLAFQTQKFLERNARGGTRYAEIILAHFGVRSPDSRLQRPEYLGGKHIPITQHQVAQTSATDGTSPQGNVAAYSLTNSFGGGFDVNKSFTEHGYIIGVACVRTNQIYQYGIEKMWLRRNLLDYYNPAFAHLGEQPILNKEIYAQGTKADDEIFGYQEAWVDYRYKPSITTGFMRSSAKDAQGNNIPIDYYHFGNKFTALPKLNADFIKETRENVDRTLAIKSTEAHQWIVDIAYSAKAIRPMPVNSVPGMIDHN